MVARILLYSATKGFRHDSIPASIEALKKKGPSINVDFDATEDETWFRDDTLTKYDAVIFLNSCGDVLDDEGIAAFQRYLDNGGNFIGIHCAAATCENAPCVGKSLGAYFDYHPPLQESIVEVIDKSHPSTAALPDKWRVLDEMYNFKSDPRTVGAKVILTADENSYEDPGPRNFDHGSPHPIAWYQERGAGVQPGGTTGRTFFTGLGHSIEIWSDETFLSHVLGGITWTLESGTTKFLNSSAKIGNGGN
ncbi:class I glutamine amidotransferase-like protein [Neolentinus lepideus HHB14362 ss-1]|uniref:Class I glutamine amidotransferase-like protein n=1 Tax=Neolentinus lepideus HHB14362 ss-1 TaxID=1314782 RepID=A0A165VHQ2_9AGAM|nr:class I glutamine amidotransferase-like protein [Neolentinus lepideus HHB14362 ss-1]